MIEVYEDKYFQSLALVVALLSQFLATNTTFQEAARLPLTLAFSFQDLFLAFAFLDKRSRLTMAATMSIMEGLAEDVLRCGDEEVARRVVTLPHPVLQSSLDGYGHCAVHYAIVKRALPAAINLIKLGAPIDTVNDDKSSPLYTAVCLGQDDVVEALLQGDNTGKLRDGVSGGKVPITEAVERGHFQIVLKLLRHGVDLNVSDSQGRCGVTHAFQGSEESVQAALDLALGDNGSLRKIDRDDRIILVSKLIKQGTSGVLLLELLKGVGEREEGIGVLSDALRHASRDALKHLVEVNGPQFVLSGTPFHLLLQPSPRKGNVYSAFEYLLELVAEEKRRDILLSHDEFGRTVLDVWADKKMTRNESSVWPILDQVLHPDLLSYVRGANEDSEKTPLLFALVRMHAVGYTLNEETLRELLDRAGPGAVTITALPSNLTLLHLLASLNPPDFIPLCEMIVARGADALSTTSDGKLPKDYARSTNCSKYLMQVSRKRKASTQSYSLNSNGFAKPKKIKKEEFAVSQGDSQCPIMYVLGDRELKWTGNAWKSFGDLSKVRIGAPEGAEHAKMVEFLTQISKTLEGVSLNGGESREGWRPFIVLNADKTVPESFRRALAAPDLSLALETKGLRQRKLLFHHSAMEGDEEGQGYEDLLDAAENASSWLKLNVTKLFHLQPGGCPELGCLPLFVGGYFDSSRIIGFVSHIVYT